MAATKRPDTATQNPSPYLKVRRIRFPFGRPDPMPQRFVDDNIVLSHVLAIVSAVVPPGEDSFIRSIRRVSSDVTDPVLKKRIAGFIGQEAVHSQEHLSLNGELAELRYPIVKLFNIKGKPSESALVRFENLAPRNAHLAVTAALEHFTATFAGKILSSNDIQALPGDAEVWHLVNWHCFEEMEHKSVAFDAYRAVGGGESLRIGVMAVIYASFLPLLGLGTLLSIATDPRGWRPIKLVRQATRVINLFIAGGVLGELATYMKPGFHPDDIDHTALLEHWQQELFGAEGELVDYVK